MEQLRINLYFHRVRNMQEILQNNIAAVPAGMCGECISEGKMTTVERASD